MAIKIDGQDLQGRYIGTDNISKVMLDGGEIRPNTVPPVNPTYHIVSNFAGSIPSGWTAGNGINVTNEGITTDFNWQHNNYTISYSGLPSLLNATKVRIEIDFKWNVEDYSENMGFTSYLGGELWECVLGKGWNRIEALNTCSYGDEFSISSLTGTGTFVSEYNMENPNSYSIFSEVTGDNITTSRVDFSDEPGESGLIGIKEATDFTIDFETFTYWILSGRTTISRCDVYIRYADNTGYIGPIEQYYNIPSTDYYQFVVYLKSSSAFTISKSWGDYLSVSTESAPYRGDDVYRVMIQGPRAAWEYGGSGRPRDITFYLNNDSSVRTTVKVDIDNL